MSPPLLSSSVFLLCHAASLSPLTSYSLCNETFSSGAYSPPTPPSPIFNKKVTTPPDMNTPLQSLCGYGDYTIPFLGNILWYYIKGVNMVWWRGGHLWTRSKGGGVSPSYVSHMVQVCIIIVGIYLFLLTSYNHPHPPSLSL